MNWYKKDAKRTKSDNFSRGNREKSKSANAILEFEWLDNTINISYFGGSNNIFADCKTLWKTPEKQKCAIILLNVKNQVLKIK